MRKCERGVFWGGGGGVFDGDLTFWIIMLNG